MDMKKLEAILTLFSIAQFVILSLTRAQDIDNAIIGEPEVKCGADNVEMQFRTRKEFKGKVFVKGHYADQPCKFDFSSTANGARRNASSITVQHGACDMQRQRMISPRGMQMSTVIIISFHPVFITGIDKAYNIKCMYREADNTVSSDLEVSALTTAVLTYTFPMPQCSYTIRKDQIDGEILKYARVGQQVVHRWQCDSDVFGILVHSCYVEDGQGERVYIVDENGCHRDRYILGDPTYVEQLNMAYRESHVFKFADRLTVRFLCQIRLCVKFDDGCRGITPPICPSPVEPIAALLLFNSTLQSNITLAGNNRTASSGNGNKTFSLRKRHKRTLINDENNQLFDLINGDFVSQDLYVLETTESPDRGSENKSESWKSIFEPEVSSQKDVCFSLTIFSTLMTIVIIVITSAALAFCYTLYQIISRKQLYRSKVVPTGHISDENQLSANKTFLSLRMPTKD